MYLFLYLVCLKVLRLCLHSASVKFGSCLIKWFWLSFIFRLLNVALRLSVSEFFACYSQLIMYYHHLLTLTTRHRWVLCCWRRSYLLVNNRTKKITKGFSAIRLLDRRCIHGFLPNISQYTVVSKYQIPLETPVRAVVDMLQFPIVMYWIQTE